MPRPQVDGPWTNDDAEMKSEDDNDDVGLDVSAAADDSQVADHRPTTKGELQKLREQFENTMRLVSHLYSDISLRDDLRMVAVATHAYHEEYSFSLKKQSKGQDRCY